MEAKVKSQGEFTIISFAGFLDIENAQSFRANCVRQLSEKKLIFNLEKTNFVGSTGIQPFLDAVKSLSASSQHGLKLVNVKAEFRRIIQNLEIHNLEIHENEASAIASFRDNQNVA